MSNKPVTKEDISRIAAVRDILFGENMSEYSKAFDEIKHALLDTQKDFENRLEKLEAKLTKRDQQLQDAMTERVKLARMLRKVADDLEK